MAGQLTIDTLKASSGVLATQNGMTGIAKAWVNYNSTAQTVTSSFNVSSVTYNTTGDFTVNFTTAMPNSTYCVAGIVGDTFAAYPRGQALQTATDYITTTSCRIRSSIDPAAYNVAANYVVIFGA